MVLNTLVCRLYFYNNMLVSFLFKPPASTSVRGSKTIEFSIVLSLGYVLIFRIYKPMLSGLWIKKYNLHIIIWKTLNLEMWQKFQSWGSLRTLFCWQRYKTAELHLAWSEHQSSYCIFQILFKPEDIINLNHLELTSVLEKDKEASASWSGKPDGFIENQRNVI